MLVKVYGSAICGIEATTVTIEVSTDKGINFFLVGLPDSAVKESQQRISSALNTYGYKIPGKKIVINLSVYLLCESIGKLTNCQLPTY